MTNRSDILVVRKSQRPVNEQHSSSDGKRIIENLCLDDSRKMQVFAGTIQPGSGSDGFSQHEGEEFAFVLEGRLDYVVDGEQVTLESGDMIYYSSRLPHSYRNNSNAPVRVLWGETG